MAVSLMERKVVRAAELASLNPADAEELLSDVLRALLRLTEAGQIREVDQTLAAMRPSTARLVMILALRELVEH